MDARLALPPCGILRRLGLAVALLFASCFGCTSTAFRKEKDTIQRNPSAGTAAQFIDDLARPWGMNTLRVEGVSLVQGLNGTGGDPPPSAEREMLLEEMRVHQVDKPNGVLASKNTALVTVRAFLPPGVQKGDPIDVEVRIPPRHQVESLHGGWLMPTQLREFARLKNRVASGHVMAMAKGDVLVDSLFTSGDDSVMHTRGRILGGGVAAKSRNLGLVVRDEHLSVATAARIGEAINKRFHIYERGLQRPVANPKRDRFVELLVHPRYQDNVIRYVRVVQSIPVRFGPGGIAAQLETLERQLHNAATSAASALKLEALGQDGVPILKAGLQQDDMEVVFYAAEALAYLNESQAVDSLVTAIKDEPAFRQRAFTALGAMNVATAHEALIDLLHDNSAETRYAAFRTLRRMMPEDPNIRGERLGPFYYHLISTHGEPLVHATRAERPEIVLFGEDHPLHLPIAVYAGDRIVVRGDRLEEITVTKIEAGEENQKVKCPPQLDAVIRSIVDLGGTYPDVVQAISQAKQNGCLKSRLEFAAIPAANRMYRRQTTASQHQANVSPPQPIPAAKSHWTGLNSELASNPLRVLDEVSATNANSHVGLPDLAPLPELALAEATPRIELAESLGFQDDGILAPSEGGPNAILEELGLPKDQLLAPIVDADSPPAPVVTAEKMAVLGATATAPAAIAPEPAEFEANEVTVQKSDTSPQSLAAVFDTIEFSP